MKRCIAAVFTLMFCTHTSALATDSLTCNGDKYSLDMSVGSDNIVDSATLSDDRKNITIFRLEEIENRQLVWIDIESDNPRNRLDIVLRSKNGARFIVKAKGRNGVLRYQKKNHKLDCNWER